MSNMKLFLLTLISLTAASPLTKRTIPSKSGYTLTWGDDFAGTSLSMANWKYDTGTGYAGGQPAWGTEEVEIMSSKNVAVANGILTIEAKNASGKWTSGRIETVQDNFLCQPNKKMMIEASIYLGNTRKSAQLGIWPAFWAMGAQFRTNGNMGWPETGEWDIVESINGGTAIYETIHCGTDPDGACNEPNGRGFTTTATRGAWHTYTFIVDRDHSSWKYETVSWYVDGTMIGSIEGQTVNNQTVWAALVHTNFFLILDVAVGGSLPDAIAGVTTPTQATLGGSGSQMEVDYVAVYNSKQGS